MNKHIPRVLQPGSVWYCFVLLAFTAAAALLDQYYLAGAELVVTIAVFIISRVRFIRRKHILMDYVQSATDAVGISVHAGTPFPMAVIRLPDNEIIWGNPGFYSITGLSDATRYQTMDRVIPGFSTTWLREGRSRVARRPDHQRPPLPRIRQLCPLGGRRDDRHARDHLFR